eukprot:TRINITY_DN5964_c0_g1_i1.p1 TRINITY_DN5964_c0_g1~~TRINITY_DN5964_c0_g1_i1.p1  ORF type:complete len:360 (-),score=61.52 TRINITY_DN5964_c0_g1_i1:66-1145(-)
MIIWILFAVIVTISFVLDVGLCSSATKQRKVLTIREALALSIVWIALAMTFNVALYFYYDSKVAMEFFASYLLEKLLSIDNVFVFYVIFKHFRIPERYQRRVLQWGIIGALLMRAVFITTGIQLLHRFHSIIFVFGALLIYTGGKLMVEGEDDEDQNFGDQWFIKWVKRYIPYLDDFGNGRFFLRVHTSLNPPTSKLYATRLFLALVTVEVMDAVFALDSIPAILSLTSDPLVVYSSNIFAILGLRALYFALSGMVHEFEYLKYGLAIILMFVGTKMLLASYYTIPLLYALLFILLTVVLSIVVSVVMSKRKKRKGPAADAGSGAVESSGNEKPDASSETMVYNPIQERWEEGSMVITL